MLEIVETHILGEAQKYVSRIALRAMGKQSDDLQAHKPVYCWAGRSRGGLAATIPSLSANSRVMQFAVRFNF